MVGSLPAGAGDTGSGPGLGGSHVPRSNWAREPQLLSLRVWSLCSATGEAAMVRGPRTVMKSGPHLPRLEKALARTEDPTQPKIKKTLGTSLAVQWLRLCVCTAGGAGSIPGWGTKIPHTAQCGQKIKKNFFN